MTVEYVSPVPENRPGMAAVRPEDGEQEGELIKLPTFDEAMGIH
jgi:hypothetical protein